MFVINAYKKFRMKEGRLSEIESSYLFRLHYQDERYSIAPTNLYLSPLFTD
jgi:hypothetical protein